MAERPDPITRVRGTEDHHIFVASNDYRMAELLNANGYLRDAWLHAPRIPDPDGAREMDVTNHWPILLDILLERRDEWGRTITVLVFEEARRHFPEHPHFCPPGVGKGEPVSGRMILPSAPVTS